MKITCVNKIREGTFLNVRFEVKTFKMFEGLPLV